MKKMILIGMVLLSIPSFAQVTRFIYQAVTQPDSTNTSSKMVENAYLDTDGKKSFFYAENRLKRDSLIDRMRATQSFNMNQMENLRSNINYTIEKDYANGQTTYKDRILRDQYSYTESQPMTWKILPETITIGDYKTQKAETTYGGRTWYVWFTMDLPYQDGPYKFSGLPGLVVKAQDAKGDYQFDLMQVKKINEFPNLTTRGQYIYINRKKFIELQQKMQKDPESAMAAAFSSMGGRMGGGGPGGPPPPPPSRSGGGDFRQEMVKRMKSNNNPIELK